VHPPLLILDGSEKESIGGYLLKEQLEFLSIGTVNLHAFPVANEKLFTKA
jgi:hypothetical protein